MIDKLRAALAALENTPDGGLNNTPAIVGLQAVIAEMEAGEPVAWTTQSGNLVRKNEKKNAELYGWSPLYTHPQPKAEPVQEPVAYLYQAGKGKSLSFDYVPGVRATKLYTHPQPKAEPVDAVTIFGLEVSAARLSALVDEQHALLVEVEDVCGRDAYGLQFEDGDSELIDKIRMHLGMLAPLQQKVEPAQAPLTDGQIDTAWRSVDYSQDYESFRIAIARAIEAAHNIK